MTARKAQHALRHKPGHASITTLSSEPLTAKDGDNPRSGVNAVVSSTG